ncbi:MAG: hypothetical protein M1826_002012 [Phylliscum demangeonii]|nr:MAG: hypothetical protein M1826_002012 [Phylliscum demangeonii]
MVSPSVAPQMPFGYTFDPMPAFQYPFPPSPAPGPSLLDDAESNMLGDFFDHVSSAAFDNSVYGFDRTGSSGRWPPDAPVTYSHHASSSIQLSPAAGRGEVFPWVKGESLSLADALSHSTSASEDVILAASLLRNGYSQASYQPDNALAGARYSQQHLRDVGHFRHKRASSDVQPPLEPPLGGPLGYVGSLPRTRADDRSRRARSDLESALSNSCVESRGEDPDHALSSSTRRRGSHQSRSIDVRWGSDGAFLEDGYVAPLDQGSEKDITKGHEPKTDYMVGRKSSASNTRASTPKPPDHQSLLVRGAALEESEGQITTPSDTALPTRPKKRQRTNDRQDHARPDVVPPAATAGGKRGKGRPAVQGERHATTSEVSGPPDLSGPPESLFGPHRTAEAQARPGRENLSEEQKRSNHILSEQKRRNLIKQGFDDLCTLVPDLSGGGFSKSAILTQAADWLEDLLAGNEELRSILASLKAQQEA